MTDKSTLYESDLNYFEFESIIKKIFDIDQNKIIIINIIKELFSFTKLY